MARVLVLFTPSTAEDCQIFEQYVEVPDASDRAQVYIEAIEVLYSFYNRRGGFGPDKPMCDPVDYYIDVLPSLGVEY